jgi:formylmethanofuran dehydrogenase subunit E
MEDNPLLVAAGRFHGHIGPFLAIGLRMGLLATESLGRAPLDMRAMVKVEPKPPRSCTVDGIQYSTGCTLGKGNIEVIPDSEAVSATFTLHSQVLTVSLLEGFRKRMDEALDGQPEKAIIDYAFQIMDTPPEEIFEVR